MTLIKRYGRINKVLHSTAIIFVISKLLLIGCAPKVFSPIYSEHERINILDSARSYYFNRNTASDMDSLWVVNHKKAVTLYESLGDIKSLSSRDFYWLTHSYAFSYQIKKAQLALIALFNRDKNENIYFINHIIDNKWDYSRSLSKGRLYKKLERKIKYYNQPNPKYLEIKGILNSVYKSDQKIRSQYKQAPTPANAILMDSIDDANLKIVKPILKKYGWLGVYDVGFNGSLAIFLTIQHSDKETISYYYPLVKRAFKNGKISKVNFAMFQDRYETYTEGMQTFGTQSFYDSTSNKMVFWKIKEIEKVNDRRAKFGLGTIEDEAIKNNISFK